MTTTQTTTQTLNLWFLTQHPELLPDLPEVEIEDTRSGMERFYSRTGLHEQLNQIAAQLPFETQLILLQKGWIAIAPNLHACIRSRSPIAVEYMKTLPDLLFRIITLPLTTEEATWVHETFRLDPHQKSHGRTLFSVLLHPLRKMNAHSQVALDRLTALGYVLGNTDLDMLASRNGIRSHHELAMVSNWLQEQPAWKLRFGTAVLLSEPASF